MSVQKYIDNYWCPTCEEVTTHEVEAGTHERDSSNDNIQCKRCGHFQFGNQTWHTENPDEN